MLTWDRDIFFGDPADDEPEDDHEIGVGAPDDWGYVDEIETEPEIEDDEDLISEIIAHDVAAIGYMLNEDEDDWDDDEEPYDPIDLPDYSLYLY